MCEILLSGGMGVGVRWVHLEIDLGGSLFRLVGKEGGIGILGPRLGLLGFCVGQLRYAEGGMVVRMWAGAQGETYGGGSVDATA